LRHVIPVPDDCTQHAIAGVARARQEQRHLAAAAEEARDAAAAHDWISGSWQLRHSLGFIRIANPKQPKTLYV
jgi:hypothetical protein